MILLPKPLAEDLETLRPGQVVWGWPHCVQDRRMTQLAIDRRVTLIAWEAMNHWSDKGDFVIHVFHKNNELAGYCSVLHAFALLGISGDYGRPLSAAVISFGATARGAVRALSALGVGEVSVLTQRPVAAVDAPLRRGADAAVRRRPGRTRGARSPTAAAARRRSSRSWPSTTSIVNCILQDTDAPLMFVMDEDLGRFRPGTLFVDVSCDEGMGFEWARPTSFAEPMLSVGRGPALLRRRPQPVVPVERGDLGEQRGAAALPADRHGRAAGVGRRRDDPPRHRDPRRHGLNPRILSFQGREATYPYAASGS